MATRKGGPKAPPRVMPNKFLIALKHKNMDVFKFDVAAEEDQNYIAASERFMEFQTQLGMVVHHVTLFRKTLEDSLQQAVELADDFSNLAAGQGGEREADPWAKQAGENAFSLKGMLEESVVSLRRHLCDELDEKMVRPLNEAVSDFSGVHAQMVLRSEMKIESFHYANKVQDLKGSQKATDERKDRNKGKYASASQGLRDQTNQLMATFAKAEQVRERLLKEDLPSVVIAKRNAFDSFAINLNRAAAEATAGEPRPPRMSDAARIPQRVMPSSDFPSTPPNNGLTVVSLDDESPGAEPPAYSSPVRVEPPPSTEVTQTIVKKRSPLPMTPKEDGAPWSGNGGAGEFGDELKRAHEHQNSKMAAESAAAAAGLPSTPKGAPTDSVTSASGSVTAASSGDAGRSPTPRAESSPQPHGSGGGGGGVGASGFSDRSAAAEAAGAAAAGTVAVVEERPETTSTPEDQQQQQQTPPEEESPARDEGGTASPAASPATTPPEDSAEKNVAAAAAGSPQGPEGDAGEGGGEEEGELEPGKHRLRALYDYDATEAGDLSFRAGDMIISDEGAFSGSGWASGDCHGNNGNFPANYTEPW